VGKPNDKCDLCHVKNRAWSEGQFFGIGSCKHHPGQPLIVLNEHCAELTEEQRVKVEKLGQKYFGPRFKARGKGMKSNSFHYHEHYVKG